ncbi:MAG: helix-turn-helix domain-containing protein [Rhodoferax sp.]|nr:helix-turn-helix domain-containing protein [Rhodoferax sp.]
MQLTSETLKQLSQQLLQERRRQGLTRAQAAGVCNVSESFIRDAESDPGRCSLTLLLRLSMGLGLRIEVQGWSTDATQIGVDQEPAR